MSILIVGGGNMASALIGGLLAHGQSPRDVVVIEIRTEAAEALEARWGIRTGAEIGPHVAAASTLVLAVKPQQMAGVFAQCPPLVPTQRVISIAAGLSVNVLRAGLGGHPNIVRAMPNTPALIREGVTGLFAPPEVSEEDRAHATALMRAVGAVVWLEDESQMDGVTAISGSGPAYVFLLMEAMIEAARGQGMAPALANRLVLETVRGAALLACHSAQSESPGQLRQRVTSPGGTTEAALAVFEREDFRGAVERAVAAAAVRSRHLGLATLRPEGATA